MGTRHLYWILTEPSIAVCLYCMVLLPYMSGAIASVATSTRSQTSGTNGAEIVSEKNDQLQFESFLGNGKGCIF
jgi:hypothetical protein